VKVALALVAACAPAFADSPKQDEILAAIQKAMNELASTSQQCWAAAATERYDIAGDLTAQIDVTATGAKAAIVHDTVGNDALASCMTAVLSKYRYAPPLAGQSFQLPFHFDAPHGQSVIDRRLVASHGQGQLSLAVLLDEANTGNSAAAMLEVAIQRGGTTDMRWADGRELWYFLGPAEIETIAGGPWSVAAGDMMYAPEGSARAIVAGRGDVHAVAIYVPGGKQGSARAGALPNRIADSYRSAPVPPRVLAARDAKTFGPATIFLDDSVVHATPLAASILQLPAGAKVAEHVHDHETEMLYVLAGSGTMTIDGNQLPIAATSVIQIPPGTKHAFVAAEAVRALQIYTPAGPEQRFKKARP